MPKSEEARMLQILMDSMARYNRGMTVIAQVNHRLQQTRNSYDNLLRFINSRDSDEEVLHAECK